MRIVALKPILTTRTDYEEIESRIKKAFLKIVYFPLLKELGLSKKKIKNAIEDLLSALNEGKITYSFGAFRGSFNASTTKEIRKLGGIWDRKSASFKIRISELPYEIRAAINSSEFFFRQKLRKIDDKLAKISPEELAEHIKVSDVFDDTLWKIEKDFQSSVDKITVAPKLTEPQAKKIADEWQGNMDLWIKNFTEEHIKELRETVQKNVYAGNRHESLIKGIKDSYGVTERKAKFLARQETNLLIAKFKETRYVDAGVREYKWACVKMPHDKTPKQHTVGNVRYSHGVLEGQIFSWDKPPVTTAPGEPVRRNNPGQDYNCLPGNALVSFHGPINKVFKRRYSGELVQLITANGTILNATANHPILTNRGWVGAKSIDIGDNIFSCKLESFFTKEMKRNDMVSTIKDIFDTLSLVCQITTDCPSESNFHGDIGLDEKIDIVSVDRELMLNVISQAYEEITHFIFERSDSSFSEISFLNTFLNACSLDSSNIVGFANELSFFLKCHLLHTQKISLSAVSNFDSSIHQPFSNRTSSDSVFSCDSQLTHPVLIILNSLLIEGQRVVSRSSASLDDHTKSSQPSTQKIFIHADDLTDFGNAEVSSFIKPSRIVDKTVRSFNGHVYNFQTDLNWYLCSDHIVANCRCFAIPIVKF